VAFGLIRHWKTYGMLDFLQLDNELYFRRSNWYPRPFGLVFRSFLFYGIAPVFLPVGAPWRNGVIESFNDMPNQMLFGISCFPGYGALKRRGRDSQRSNKKTRHA